MVALFNDLISISIHALREESDATAVEIMQDEAEFQSTLSVRRATDQLRGQDHRTPISIHALREESDWSQFTAFLGNCVFQSTLSVRRATYVRLSSRLCRRYFNPRSP